MIRLTAEAEIFPIAGEFRISRGARTEAHVVTATITDGTHTGRGETVPYPRYKESVEGVMADIKAIAPRIADGMDPDGLRSEMKPGAARNAVDCALIDFLAKQSGTPAAERLGILLSPLTTAYTLSIGEPEAMGEAARQNAHRPLLKIKLGLPTGDDKRIRAVREGAPDATLIVDANEGWTGANLLSNMSACADAGVALLEQPLPAARDGVLANVSHPVPVCADESCHTADDLAALRSRYDAVNIKLNKAGGLTEALEMVKVARREDFRVMVGCMLSTSLAIAPAILAAQGADFVDLDGPLLLAADRDPPLRYEGSLLHPPPPVLWG